MFPAELAVGGALPEGVGDEDDEADAWLIVDDRWNNSREAVQHCSK